MYRTIVWITTQFVAFHRYEGASDRVAFLRNDHRHVFHVKVGFLVNHHEREVEFFTAKESVEAYLKTHYEGQHMKKSCEQIAAEIFKAFEIPYCVFVEVSEDGENGARVERTQTVELQ